MHFQFDPKQQYQLDAIAAVTDLFNGQPTGAAQLHTTLTTARSTTQNPTQTAPHTALFDTEEEYNAAFEIGAIGNNLQLSNDALLANLNQIQDRNGLECAPKLTDGLQFDVEMETGTGKTYVYLRTAYELAKLYGFTKFIILVPSVAIREGVKTSIDLMRTHFKHLYPQLNMDARVYAGERAEDVRDFATSNSLQFLIMTIDSIRGNAKTRVLYQTRDRLGGLRPLDYLRATRPIVIMDEPQNMESLLAQSAIADLNPLCTLRYSATHRTTRNVVYRLDPIDARELGLVKQIIVADAQLSGASAKPYVKLLGVTRQPFRAKLELLVKRVDGTYAKKAVSAKVNDDLERLSNGNPAYKDNWRISEISILPAQIELTNHGKLVVGEEIGGATPEVSYEMIRETIREHIRKELQVHKHGIKVLSLFFIDKVASYLGNGVNNLDATGEFATAFDEIYREERAKQPDCHSFLPADPTTARSGYFAQMKTGSGKTAKLTFKDSSGTTKADDEAYALIMKDKARLLDLTEPVRFIFSHSALREGWDNPNVFQICSLRNIGSDTERRQTIGRGLRLPVNQHGERIIDDGIAQLTVIANESYKQFAAALQNEYQKAGVSLGVLRREEFAKIPITTYGKETILGSAKSAEIWEIIKQAGFIAESGEVLAKFTPESANFTLNLPEKFAEIEYEVINQITKCRVSEFIKQKRDRRVRKLNKQLYATPEFEAFWEKITQRTTYKVSLNRNELITKCVTAIKAAPPIAPIQIKINKTELEITRGGSKNIIRGERANKITQIYQLPDIVGQLQETTSLTRKTIIDILLGSERSKEFLDNPNDFIKMAHDCITTELAHVLIEGIQYEPIGGSIYELRELQADGITEKDYFIDQLYRVRDNSKTDFDYVICDSAIERQFAEYLDGKKDIKLFMKLPSKFRIPTPVGDYNPDWAIIKIENGSEHLYLIRETKHSKNPRDRRPSENAKINAALKHFEAIDVGYTVSAPESWEA